MFRRIFPRMCRNLQGPCRQMSKKGGMMMRFRPRQRMSPWENVFDDAQRTPFRPFDDAFRNVANRVERMMAPGWQGWQGYAARPCARWGVAEEAGTEVNYDSRQFQVKVDVDEFEPEDLNVKVTGNRLVISGRHESKPDQHGFVSREFTREFVIPEDVDLESLSSKITSDGLLMIEALVKSSPQLEGKSIKIERATDKNKDENKS